MVSQIPMNENQSMTIAEERLQQLVVLSEKLSTENLSYHLYKENGWLFIFNKDYSEVRYVLLQKGNIYIQGGKDNFEQEYGENMTIKDPTFTSSLDQFAFVVSSKEKAFLSGSVLGNWALLMTAEL